LVRTARRVMPGARQETNRVALSALISAAFVVAAAPPSGTTYYAFLAENGRMIGHASHELRQGREGV
jgi:hypothetical protein